MTTNNNAVFLSGWEYNRILQDDPFLPRNSALPGELLWHGGAQLWLFEKVYCTKEALDNERAAGERLGWVTGKIFAELAAGEDKFIEPIDLRDLDLTTKKKITDLHAELRADPAVDIRAWLKSPCDEFALDRVKTAILQPILEAKSCILGASPNTLRHWKPMRNAMPNAVRQSELAVEQTKLIAKLSEPITNQNNGLNILSKPGSKLSIAADEREKQVRRELEEPLISDLLAGDGEFAGPQGYVAYHKKLEPHKAAYGPSDEIMAAEWKASKTKLFKLRDLASKHLWPQLHREWLPELRKNPDDFLPEFDRLLKEALRGPYLAPLLNLPTDLMITLFGTGVSCIAELEGKSAMMGLFFGTAVGAAFYRRLEEQRKRIGPLAMFYQKAKNLRESTNSVANF